MEQLPSYVTRFETARSDSSSEPYIEKGLVITGPNAGRYVSAKGSNVDEVHAEFLRLAAQAFSLKKCV